MDAPAYNMPAVAPAFRLPPYRYNHIRRLTFVLEAEPGRIRRFLPEPFEYVSNRYVVWLEHRVDENPGPTTSAFPQPFDTHEASVDVAARFRGLEGTHIPMMWVPTSEADFARALAGRELQGFGKKTAHFSWEERLIDDEIRVKLTRNGIDLVDATVKLDGEPAASPLKMPLLGLKEIPRVDGTGYDVRKVIALDKFEYQEIASRGARVVSLRFGESREDPLYELTPTKIVGATFSIWHGRVYEGCGREIADLLAEAHAAKAEAPVAAAAR